MCVCVYAYIYIYISMKVDMPLNKETKDVYLHKNTSKLSPPLLIYKRYI